MIALINHHIKRITNTKRTLGLAALVLLPGLLIFLGGQSPDAGFDVVSGTVVGLTGTVFGLATLILTAAVLRDERDDGTMHFIYLKPMPRVQLAAGAWMAGLLTSLALAVVCWLGIVLGTVLIDGDMTVGSGTLVLLLLAAVGYSALFVPLGYMMKRIVLGGLAYIIVWEGIIATLITGVSNTSVWRLALSGYADFIGTNEEWVIEALGPVQPGVWGAIAKVAVVAVLGVGFLTWALQTRDTV